MGNTGSSNPLESLTTSSSSPSKNQPRSDHHDLNQPKIAENIGKLLCDINLLNYLCIQFLYTPHFYLYFELMNRDFFENVQKEEIRYIPADYLKVNMFRVYHKENDKTGTSNIEEHRKAILSGKDDSDKSFVLPLSIMENTSICKQWKMLTVQDFYKIFEKAKHECHIHQLMTEKDQKKQNMELPITTSLMISEKLTDESELPNLPPSPLLPSTNKNEDEEELCSICMDAPPTITTGCCSSQFCEDCIREWNKKNTTCPVCRKTLNVNSQKEHSDAWVTVQKEDLMSRAEVAHQFLRFTFSIVNPFAISIH